MSRLAPDVQAELGALLPDGWAWNHDPASNTIGMLAGAAQSFADFEAAAEAQTPESEPGAAFELLADYERVLGPDTCLGDPSALTFDQRRSSVSARWVYPADASIAGLTALAASYGAAVSITQLTRNCCGVLRCGNTLRPHPEEFTWVVSMPAAQVRKFRCGAGHTGDPLGVIERNTVVECVLRRAAPAHTVPVFNYGVA